MAKGGGLLAVAGVGYGAFARLMSARVLMSLGGERDVKSAGDLQYVVEAVTGWTLPGAVSGLLLLVVACGAILLWVVLTVRRLGTTEARVDGTLFGVTGTTLALKLFSKKSWPPYLMLVLFPLLLPVASDGRRWVAAAIGGFGVVALVEHSYWATVLHQFAAADFHAGLVRGTGGALSF